MNAAIVGGRRRGINNRDDPLQRSSEALISILTANELPRSGCGESCSMLGSTMV